MPTPSQLNITIATAALPSGVSNPVVVSIPTSLTTLDSEGAGYSGPDVLLGSIAKRGGLWATVTGTNGIPTKTFFPLSSILNVTYQ